MLPGITPALFGGGKLLPAQANGNDSYVVSLLHFDAPDAQIGVAGLSGCKDYAYGAPYRRDAWIVGAGTGAPSTAISYPFNQVASFPGGTTIQCPDHADFDFGAGDFTIDFWAAFVSASTNGALLTKQPNSSSFAPFAIYQVNPGQLQFYASTSGSAWEINLNLANGFSPGVWYHFAITRAGATWRTFINGGLVATATSANPVVKTTAPVTIGGLIGFSSMAGWLDEFRISKGIARWTANFTPPNQPYYAQLSGGNDAATKLLLHFDNDTFLIDSANGALSPHAVTNFGATVLGGPPNSPVLTTNVVMVTGGTTRLVVAASNDLNIMRGNFTLDFMYYRGGSSTTGTVVARRNTGAQLASFNITDNGNGSIGLLMSASGSAWDVNATVATGIPASTWVHLALVRDGPTLRFFLNGAQTWTQNVSTGPFWNNSNVLTIGNLSDGGTNTAILEELRYSDVARWTGPFTAPVPGGAPYS